MDIGLIKRTILVVDDVPENIDILDRLLNKDYKIKVALNGKKALNIALSGTPPDLILLDIMMPGMDGYEVCRRLKADSKTKSIPILFVTAKGEIKDETKGLELGAADYIIKPVSPSIIKARVRNHMNLYLHQEHLEVLVAQRTLKLREEEQKLKDTLESLRRSFRSTIQVMISAVEKRDPYTSGHQIRVANIARSIATEMGLSQDIIEAIRMAGPIHDIGKLSVPAEILSKPGKLPQIEFSLIKEHAQTGYEMLKDVESPWLLAEIVYQHHERMDGSGYPRGLKGDDILIEARILAVADVVESMASHRPYRAAFGINAALEEIEKNREKLYDVDVVDACLRLFREKGFQIEGT